MPPANRIGIYYAPPSKELEPVDLTELQAAVHREQCRQQQAWQVAYQRGSEDGYACGWVHASFVLLGLTLAAAAWRAW